MNWEDNVDPIGSCASARDKLRLLSLPHFINTSIKNVKKF